MKKITLLCMLLITSFAFSQEDCASVVDLGALTSPYMGDTTGAVNNFSEDCLTNAGAPDQVFSILVPAGNTLTIGQTENSYDSKHRLAYGAACPGDMLVVCTDDPDTSTVTWYNDTGSDQTAYWTQSAYTTGSGAFTLAWSMVSCAAPAATGTVVDDCANSQFSVDVDITDLGDATSLSISNDAGIAATTGINTTGIYTVGPFTVGTDVIITLEHADNSDCNVDLGTYNFACPPANDDCANAESLSIPTSCVTTTITTEGATEGPDELNSCDAFGNLGLWYRFVAPASGALEFESGTGIPGIVIYEGACGALTEVAGTCSNNASTSISGLTPGNSYYAMIWTDAVQTTADFCLYTLACSQAAATGTVVEDCANNQFTVDVDVTTLGDAIQLNDGATTYTISGTGIITVGPYASGTSVTITVEHSDSTCDFDLGTYSSTCPPANDECDGAVAVACDDVVNGSTTAATDSGGNPAFDVWYSYENLGVTEDVTISLCGSAYDTNIRVYSDCPGTNQIATNDDSCDLQSEVTFTNDGSQAYYIMVEGYNTATGNFTMSVTCDVNIPAPANDNCDAPEMLPLGVTVSGTTAGATDQGTGPDDDTTCDPFDFHADVWYAVEITGGTSDLTVTTTTTGTSDEAGIAIYPDQCDFLDASQLACGGGDAVDGATVTANGLDVGTYYIRVWSNGIAARNSQRVEGTFDIIANAALSTDEFEQDLSFTYFPNPVTNNLTLKAQKEIENVTIYNMLGQEVLTNTPNEVESNIEMSSLQSGAYFVKVTIESVTETIRVIKN